LSLLLLSCSRAPAGSAAPPPSPLQSALPPQARASAAPFAGSAPSANPAPSAGLAAPAAPSTPSEAPKPVTPFEGGRRAVTSQYGLVVAVEAQAARAGARVLEEGGNAVDAAIATLFALAVTHPSAASLGGGGFALVRPASGELLALDFVPVAPAALTRSAFDHMIASGGIGPRAVGVPGLVAGLGVLHQRFATLPLSTLIAPAIRLARGQLLGHWPSALVEASRKDLVKDPTARRLFLEKGHAHAAGTRFAQPELAWSLQRIAEHGTADFYQGELAQRLARALAVEGFAPSDLATYRAIEREPLRLRYRDVDLVTMGPPSAGGVALIGTLLAAEAAPAALKPGSADDIHWLLEAERRAQAERRLSVVDPEALPATELEARRSRWLERAFWLRLPIDAQRATPSEAVHSLTLGEPVESEHTTHISVVDRDGMVVSLTTTLCASFGARVAAAGTGIVLNNAVATFATMGENQPFAGRRTTSSMAPTLLLDAGRVLAVLGTPGGDTIPSTLAQIIRHLVDERAPLDVAVEAPRWHHGFVPDRARYEPSPLVSRALLKELETRGHRLRPFPHRVGDANCIVLDGELARGYADSREPGLAVAAREPGK
jgi:gamma-glutamyltranspeptidase/glutathione hydrolase